MRNKVTKGYMILAVAYMFILMVSNLMAGKLLLLGGPGGIVLDCATIIFPLVYIMSDLMTEVYGIELSMLSIRINVICSVVMAGLLLLLVYLPYPSFWQGQEAYAKVFTTTPRIIVASLCAYYFGDWSNSAILSVLKIKAPKKGFAYRAILSTVVGQCVDTGIFVTLAFIGTMPGKILIQMMLAQYIFKVSYETICVPITTRVVVRWKKWDMTDHLDDLKKDKYNPFSV